MRISDLYPNMNLPSTTETTTPRSPSPGMQKVANDAANGKKSGNRIGLLFMLIMGGVLIGFKYFRERG